MNACRVADLGREFAAVIEASDRIDAALLDASNDSRRELQRRNLALFLRSEDIKRHASFHSVASPLGALFVVNCLGEFIDTVRDKAESVNQKESNEAMEADAMLRMAYSLRAWIEAETGLSADDVGGEYLMARRLDMASAMKLDAA